MAEEQRWQGGHRPCANNCGFFGSPATLDLCSKCYRDLNASQSQSQGQGQQPPSASEAVVATSPEPEAPAAASSGAGGGGRCACCRRRVGLTGFTCRCGATFCGVHRYPERHACAFDFRAAGRDAIARANPIVRGDKLKDKA